MKFIRSLLLIGVIAICAAFGGHAVVISSFVLGITTNFFSGSYSAFLNPQNASGLVHSESFTINPATFPNLSGPLVWSYPTGTTTIKAFEQVCGYGDYYNTSPPAHVTPSQINTISTLSVSHNISFTGTTNGYDVIYDYFLTPKANLDATHLFEVEVFLRTPAYSQTYINSGGVTQIGTTTFSGITWQVAIDYNGNGGVTPDILVAPSSYADVPSATIDLTALHSYLISQGILTGYEYYNGDSLGVEVAQGTGSASVTSCSVSYAPGTATFPTTSSPDAWWQANAGAFTFHTCAGVANTSGNGVQCLIDLSGNQQTLTNILNAQPSIQGIGVKPYLSFNGTSNNLITPGSLGLYAAGASSQFCAIQSNSNAVQTFVAGEGNSTQNNTIYGTLTTNSITATSASGFIRNDAGTANLANSVPVQVNVFNASPHVYGVVDNGSSLTPWLDGVAGTAVPYTRSGTYTLNTFTLGGIGRTTISLPWAGRIQGCIMWKRAITGTEAGNASTYLATLQ